MLIQLSLLFGSQLFVEELDIPYCFVKGKAKLGQLVHQKNAAVVALNRS
jgi:ribosomal protein L7Ae-like RNA K-turn-binding protein